MRYIWIVLFSFVWLWGCHGAVPPALPDVRACLQDQDCQTTQRCTSGVCTIGERTPTDATNEPFVSDEAFPPDEPALEQTLEPVPDTLADKTPDTTPDTTPDNTTETLPEVRPETPDVQDTPCTSSVEICDGKDNDCDGDIDEEFPEDGKFCSVPSQKGPCAQGVSSCQSGQLVCKQFVFPKSDEICDNNVDDNCDGAIDEFPPCVCKTGQTRVCFNSAPKYLNVGVCQAGVQTCKNNAWGVCLGEVLPGTESCNGKDDDCNNKVDDVVYNPPKLCTTAPNALGVTCTNGITTCQGGTEVCVGTTPKTETMTQFPNVGNTPGKLMPCTPAIFSDLFGVAVDPVSKAIFLSDEANHTIHRYDPATEKVTTIAGVQGTNGHEDGPANVAKFDTPMGLTWYNDALYVADRRNHVIRKLTPLTNGSCGNVTSYTGFCVSTLVGVVGQSGFSKTPLPVSQATLKEPRDVTFGAKGIMFIVDTGNHAIRQLENGLVSTIGGTGMAASPTSSAVFGQGLAMKMPLGVAVASNGIVYIAETDSHIIRMIEPSGTMRVLAGRSRSAGYLDSLLPHVAQFSSPSGVALDAREEYLYVADSGNYAIRKIRLSDGVVTTVAGQPRKQGFNNAAAEAARFHKPGHIAFAPDGRLLIVEQGKQVLRYYSPTTSTSIALVGVLVGHNTPGTARDGDALCASLHQPTDMLFDAKKNQIYITVHSHHLVFRIDLATRRMSQFAGTGEDPFPTSFTTNPKRHRLAHPFNTPYGLAQDSAGVVYVSDLEENIIFQVDSASMLSRYAGSSRGSYNSPTNPLISTFYFPAGMCFDQRGDLFVADFGNHLVRRIEPSGKTSTLAGSRVAGSRDGKGVAARFNSPLMLACDASNNVYVTEDKSHLIRKIDVATNVSTEAGAKKGFAEGVGAMAQFNDPWKIIALPNKNYLISDAANHRLRLLTPAGQVSTYLGTGAVGNVDDVPGKATLHSPVGLAFDEAGRTLYSLQYGSGALRRVRLCSP